MPTFCSSEPSILAQPFSELIKKLKGSFTLKISSSQSAEKACFQQYAVIRNIKVLLDTRVSHARNPEKYTIKNFAKSWKTTPRYVRQCLRQAEEYFKTKDILHVKERLGHRSITSTLIYTHLVNFESDEYHTATSKSLRQDEELLKAGFEYVTDRDEIKIYRKRK